MIGRLVSFDHINQDRRVCPQSPPPPDWQTAPGNERRLPCTAAHEPEDFRAGQQHPVDPVLFGFYEVILIETSIYMGMENVYIVPATA